MPSKKQNPLKARAEDKARRLSEENKKLQARLEQALGEVERLRHASVVDVEKCLIRPKSGGYTRVFFTDVHGMRADKAAVAATISDLKVLRPAELINGGDFLDCDGFLSSHKPVAYTQKSPYSFEEDVEACRSYLDSIDKACPDARKDYLQGNHEHRIQIWINENAETERDREYFRKCFGAEEVLSLEKRRWKWYERGVQHEGLTARGAIKRGDCFFIHGHKSGKNNAKKYLDEFSYNVCYGHDHKADASVTWREGTGTIGAWNAGCLCETHPMWGHSQTFGWVHGYVLQFQQKGGRFLSIPIQIIKGRSLLEPMLKCLGVSV